MRPTEMVAQMIIQTVHGVSHPVVGLAMAAQPRTAGVLAQSPASKQQPRTGRGVRRQTDRRPIPGVDRTDV